MFGSLLVMLRLIVASDPPFGVETLGKKHKSSATSITKERGVKPFFLYFFQVLTGSLTQSQIILVPTFCEQY
jgi:hypothetical protein